MKKHILLLILLISVLFGCANPLSPSDAAFYYPKAEFGYNSHDGAIAYEIRNNRGISSNADLLNLYLKGPADEDLRNPFPEDLTVISVYTLEDTVYVTVSDTMAKLSGAPLILSCACLGRTAMGLSNTTCAEIKCETLLLDGKKQITVNENTVFYSDIFHQSDSEVS